MSRILTARDLTVLGAGTGAVAAVVLLLRKLGHISPTTVALLLLVVVLCTATAARLRVATTVSVVAMLAFNYFFLPPVGTLTIAEPQNWVALLVFLIVAVMGSNLSAAAQRRTREAIERRNEVTRLFDLTRDVLLTTETVGAIPSIVRHVARRFELSGIAVFLPDDIGWRAYQGGEDEIVVHPDVLNTALAKARATLEFDATERAYGGHIQVGPGGETSLVPLRHGTRPIGLLAATTPRLDIGTLDAVAGVVAMAIERAQFLAERDAAELVRQKADLASTLLASLSHDLRTPLTAIGTAVENLRGDLPVAERAAQAGAAMAELERLTRLFRDILDMARIDAAAIRVNREWVAPGDVVDAAVAHVRHALDTHPVHVDSDDGREIQIDPRLASVALSHLLENAALYSSPGKDIRVDARTDGEGLRVSVLDEGPGLDPGELEHLFERFYRGRSARRTTFGTGMGLAITRGLLAAAGGRVWAENVPGAGARFSMTVPGPARVVTMSH